MQEYLKWKQHMARDSRQLYNGLIQHKAGQVTVITEVARAITLTRQRHLKCL